jgi:hypothetical protein
LSSQARDTPVAVGGTKKEEGGWKKKEEATCLKRDEARSNEATEILEACVFRGQIFSNWWASAHGWVGWAFFPLDVTL